MEPESINDILNGSVKGTTFLPSHSSMKSSRQKWVLGLPPQGEISVDAGAANAIMMRKSLFAAGIIHVKGTFGARDVRITLISVFMWSLTIHTVFMIIYIYICLFS